MSIREQIQQDLKQAMRDRDEHRKTALRVLMSEINRADKETGQPVDEQQLTGILTKQAKRYQESIDIYREQGRQDLVDKETAELAAIETYLPKQLSRAEVEAIVRQTIDEVGASDLSALGSVMKSLMPKIKGQADGKLVNEIVREQLAGGE